MFNKKQRCLFIWSRAITSKIENKDILKYQSDILVPVLNFFKHDIILEVSERKFLRGLMACATTDDAY